MKQIGFSQSLADECLYILKSGKDVCFAIVHVDDMVLASTSDDLIKLSVNQLQKSYKIKSLGDLKKYLTS